AYGKVLKDASIAVYRQLSDEPNKPPIGSRDYQFIVGIYKEDLANLKNVGVDRSKDEEDNWPPPSSIKDPLNGSWRIYHKGQMRPSTEKEAAHLERAAGWHTHHIVDRIMGSNKWHKEDF